MTEGGLVLVVDDDEANLTVFESLFADDFNIALATSGEQALKLMQRQAVAVLLTDQRMPGLSGVDLCARAAEVSPDTLRILITAYSDLSAAIDAINRGQVRRYLKKPWDPDELRLELKTALETWELAQKLQALEVRLARTQQVASVNTLARALTHEMATPIHNLVYNLKFCEEGIAELGPFLRTCTGPSDGDKLARLVELEEEISDASLAADQIHGVLESHRSMQMTTKAKQREHHSIREITELAIRVTRRHGPPGTKVQAELTSDAKVSGTQTELIQIVSNLLLNAMQAPRVGDKPRRVLLQTTQEGDFVMLNIHDNGPGVAPERRGEIFRPFRTSRVQEGGSGLGLAVIREIASELGGLISVSDSAVEGGACFTVSLPIAGPAPAASGSSG